MIIQNNNIRIRTIRYTAEDKDALYTIWKDSWPYKRDKLTHFGFEKIFPRVIDNNDDFITYVGGGGLGIQNLFLCTVQGPNETIVGFYQRIVRGFNSEIRLMMIHPSFQGQGLQKQFMNLISYYAYEILGITSTTAHIFEDNTPSMINVGVMNAGIETKSKDLPNDYNLRRGSVTGKKVKQMTYTAEMRNTFLQNSPSDVLHNVVYDPEDMIVVDLFNENINHIGTYSFSDDVTPNVEENIGGVVRFITNKEFYQYKSYSFSVVATLNL